MRLDKASLSVCFKSTTVSVTAALDLFKPLNQQCVFEGMSRQVTACLHLGLLCKCVCAQFVKSVCQVHMVCPQRRNEISSDRCRRLLVAFCFVLLRD